MLQLYKSLDRLYTRHTSIKELHQPTLGVQIVSADLKNKLTEKDMIICSRKHSQL